MPSYSWRDNKSGKIQDVIRVFAEYTVPPTEEESGLKPEDTEWERVILGAPTVNKPWNWGRKGSWVLALLFLGLGGCVTPERWTSSNHQDMMLRCRVSCDGIMSSYDSWLGKCICGKD